MDLNLLNRVGFAFALHVDDNGMPYVKVVDPWQEQHQPVSGLTIKLRPYASYSEAREIANFINSKLFHEKVPLLDLQGA